MARGGLKPLTPLLFLSKLLLSLNNIHKNVPRDRGLRVSSAFPLPKSFPSTRYFSWASSAVARDGRMRETRE